MRSGVGVPASFRSPTWAVDLTGRRVSPVLHLPLGLAGATGSGPLTLNLVTGRVQLWNAATGQPVRMNLPADASFVAAGRGPATAARPQEPVLGRPAGGCAQQSVPGRPRGDLPGQWFMTPSHRPSA